MRTKVALVVLMVAMAVVANAQQSSSVTLGFRHPAFEVDFPGSEVSLQWSVSNGLLKATVTYGGKSWLGFGLNPEGGMVHADTIVARFDEGPTPTVTDRFAFTYDEPKLDTSIGGTNDILSFSATQTNDSTTMTFVRKLDTGDKYDHKIGSSDINVIWAHGSDGDNSFGYHGGSNRGVFCLNFITGNPCPPPLDKINLPTGFKVEVFANVPRARTMVFNDDKSVLFVGTWINNLYAVDVASRQVTLVKTGLDMPNGVTYFNGTLFVAETQAITRYDNVMSTFPTLPKGKVIATFPPPPAPNHAWKHIRVGPDGHVYTSVNSPCNTCFDEDPYGTMIRMNWDGSNVKIIARGIRDTQGFDFDPVTGNIWWTDNGRDDWGNDNPPDELNLITRLDGSQHFGFPYCYGTDIPDPDFNKNGSCKPYVPPMLNLPAHTAALAVKFYQGDMFPPAYAKDTMYIAEHGSWNRDPPFGYRVTRVRLNPDRTVASYDVFADGWLQGTSTVLGRPVDFAFLPDGSMLVSDDSRGIIYRIYYTAK